MNGYSTFPSTKSLQSSSHKSKSPKLPKPHTSSNHNNPNNTNNKDLITSITSKIKEEFNSLNIETISNNFLTHFPYQTLAQTSFINALCTSIQNVKISLITTIPQLITSKQIKTVTYFSKEEQYINMIFSINTEIKTLIKNSKAKIKQINDLLTTFALQLKLTEEHVNNHKTQSILDKLSKFDKIKYDISMNIFVLDDIQNKFYDNVKDVIKNAKIDTTIPSSSPIRSSSNNNNNRNNSPTPIGIDSNGNSNNSNGNKKIKSSYMSYSLNGKKLNKNNSVNVIKNGNNNNNNNNVDASPSNNMKHNKEKSVSPNTNNINNDNNSNNKQANNPSQKISFYKHKNKELQKTIEDIKKRLQREQETKTHLQNELILLKQKSFLSVYPLNTPQNNNNNNITNTNNVFINHISKIENKVETLSSKLKNIAEMLITFSFSMTHLRDSLIRKNLNLSEMKLDYKTLQSKLLSIINDTINIKAKLDKCLTLPSPTNNNNNDITTSPLLTTSSKYNTISHTFPNTLSFISNTTPYEDVVASPKTNVKNEAEFNNISSIIDTSNEFINASPVPTVQHKVEPTITTSDKKVETNLCDKDNDNDTIIEVNHNLNTVMNSNSNNNNMNTHCLNSKVLTFRNDDICSNPKQSNNTNQGNTNLNYGSPIIEEQNSNKDQHIETLITENNNLKSQLAQMLLNNSQNEIEELKTELSKAEEKIKELNQSNSISLHNSILPSSLPQDDQTALTKQIKELNHIISLKDTEIEQYKLLTQKYNENIFNKLKDNYKNSLSNIKSSYELMLTDKVNSINDLNKTNKLLNKKLTELNKSLCNVQNDKRTQNILNEASISKLENEKMSLEITIEHLTTEIETLKQTVTVSSHINTDDNVSLTQLKQNVNELETHNKSIQNQLDIVNGILITKDNTIQTLQLQLNELNSKINILNDIIETKEKDIIALQSELNDKKTQMNTITQNYQNDLNELNTSVILLKSQLSKTQSELYITSSINNNNNNSNSSNTYVIVVECSFTLTQTPNKTEQQKDMIIISLQKENISLKNQLSLITSQRGQEQTIFALLNPESSNDNNNNNTKCNASPKENTFSSQQYHKQKDELNVLKVKLRQTLEENKTLENKVHDLEFAAKKEKEKYIDVLRVSFERFLNETQITTKNKELATLTMKMMDLSDEDIKDIWNTMAKKKGGMFGFLRK